MQFSFTALVALATTGFASAAQLTQFTNWGANPGGLPRVDIYVPDRLASKPPVIVGLHPCGGTGQQFHGMTKLSQYADRLGYILVYPTSKSQSSGFPMNCWDVHSPASLRRGGGGESESVANLVNTVLSRYNGDASKVFVVGASSGAMMTNNMAALYPDIFDAGASWSGVPAGCWEGAPASNPMSSDTRCANGQKNLSKKEWGDLARRMGPSNWTGKRTRMLIVAGTNDNLVVWKTYLQQLDQWSDVHGVELTKQTQNKPVQNWIERSYGDGTKLLGFDVQGGGHIPPFQEETVLKFFGLL